MRTEEDSVRVGRLKNTLVRAIRVSSGSVQLTSRGTVQDAEGVRFTHTSKGTHLDGKELRHQEDAACLGGLCRASSSVVRLPLALLLGERIRDLFWNFIDQQPGVVQKYSKTIKQNNNIIPEHHVDAFRLLSAILLSCDVIELVRAHRCTTPLRAGILEAWAARAQDPGIRAVN